MFHPLQRHWLSSVAQACMPVTLPTPRRQQCLRHIQASTSPSVFMSVPNLSILGTDISIQLRRNRLDSFSRCRACSVPNRPRLASLRRQSAGATSLPPTKRQSYSVRTIGLAAEGGVRGRHDATAVFNRRSNDVAARRGCRYGRKSTPRLSSISPTTVSEHFVHGSAIRRLSHRIVTRPMRRRLSALSLSIVSSAVCQ